MAVIQIAGRLRSSSPDALSHGLGDGVGQAVARGSRSVRGLGVLAVAATAAFALPACRRFASVEAPTDVDQQP
ncbi:hypothetical protein AB5J72_08680 [Streptomyces sp. CG1]|uniref:hypothetical protein n=1 Tax=Streptomyces sp. CG1 TaxID=1287523 RepID=UPI0034E28CC8